MPHEPVKKFIKASSLLQNSGGADQSPDAFRRVAVIYLCSGCVSWLR